MPGLLLEGKVAVITGAASGIGRAAASVFTREGAKVILVDIDEEGGEKAVAEIGASGGEAVFIRTDVTSSDDVAAMVERAVTVFGRLNCAFNNAGIDSPSAPTAEYPEESFDRTIAVNLKGVWLCMKHELRQMAAQGYGAIVNTASVAALVGFAGVSGYVAAKHGVAGLTRNAALEYAKQGIRVNAVCPGVIRTPMLDSALRKGLVTEEFLLQMEPIGRFGQPEEIGEAAAWLCSDRSSFVLGHVMPVDGGYTVF